MTNSVAIATRILTQEKKESDVHNLYIPIYSYTKFHQIIFFRFKVIAGSRFADSRTDGQTDGRTDGRTDGG